VIQPRIVEKMVHRIFVNGEGVHIGDIELTQQGYSCSKLFGGREYVHWTDPIYVPQFSAGNVIVYKIKNGKGVSVANLLPISTLSMSSPNAVILPDLITRHGFRVNAHLSCSSSSK
jgi:hypothetical protein